MLQSLENPGALFQYSQDEFRNQLQLKADRRAEDADQRAAEADALAAAAPGLNMQEKAESLKQKRELTSIREALVREAAPSISETKIPGVRAGIVPTAGADNAKAKYDYDPVKVQKALVKRPRLVFRGKRTL
ncbi:hypothetical protein [Delftia sp. JD2]|uniref:hypothetical protein n=1 Tax=Delftia sp. JD2 TaxID=469553 RepID=UPI00080681ED|nr:hypothetical protein [Delftia sp. JD2]